MLRPSRFLWFVSLYTGARKMKDCALGAFSIEKTCMTGSSSSSSTLALGHNAHVAEDFFFCKVSEHGHWCRLCGKVPCRGAAHTTSPMHIALESIMSLLLNKALQFPHGPVGLSSEAAYRFFSQESLRWERSLFAVREEGLSAGSGMSSIDKSAEREEVACVEKSHLNLYQPAAPWRQLVERRAARLFGEVRLLSRLGVLGTADILFDSKECGGPQRDGRFQRMECIGDHNWGHSTCHRLIVLFPEVQWRSVEGVFIMDTLRTVLESNHHLHYVFTQLLMADCNQTVETHTMSAKFKAVVVEAIAGELHVALWSLQSPLRDGITRFSSLHGVPFTPIVASMVQRCLDDLMDLVVFSFVGRYSSALTDAVMALAHREQYAQGVFSPPLTVQKKRRKPIYSNGLLRWMLPPLPSLSQRDKGCKTSETRDTRTSATLNKVNAPCPLSIWPFASDSLDAVVSPIAEPLQRCRSQYLNASNCEALVDGLRQIMSFYRLSPHPSLPTPLDGESDGSVGPGHGPVIGHSQCGPRSPAAPSSASHC
ncbi:hypothetical protein, conserved [Trypanosoma vivax Y486]|uniref:Uncharacterized protein n=1 Tax=Trypanosoma vivax (strain Y486) TaxID=1055687 RepID=F9WKR2_TRYVY|nr:hypothetical protein, conserved [Trypanosoma vivax Y486]|eukprot:CCD18085.1 hypothetical protein, conserved [Trypanosoma vivax Y486]